MLKVRVNATSANLAVGFDVLGLALNIYNSFTFKKSDSFSLNGFLDEFNSFEKNLVFKSYIEVFNYLDKEPIPVAIGIECNIPIERGLGSSSSLIVGGAFGANAILGYPLDDDELFNICAKIEGHPDNVAPAIFGGLTSSYRVKDSFKAFCYKVSEDLSFSLLVPSYKVKTEEARELLPKSLPYSDITYTMGRLIALPKAMAIGDMDSILEIMDDRLHEPYRKSLIKGYNEIKSLASSNGVASAISGSGSTILLIADSKDKLNKISYEGYEKINVSLGSGVIVED